MTMLLPQSTSRKWHNEQKAQLQKGQIVLVSKLSSLPRFETNIAGNGEKETLEKQQAVMKVACLG